MAPATRMLSPKEARGVYDRIGRRQDSQAFYEDRATDALIRHGEFGRAQAVFEFGCGTGRFAARLLGDLLPQTATYHAVDLSSTMVELARARLEPFGGRVDVRLTDGGPPADRPAGGYDRFVSNYVLDLLAEPEIRALLSEAHRMLQPSGLLCVASLSTGATPISRLVARAWSGVHRLNPALVGGCRPLRLEPLLPESQWRIVHHAHVAPFAIPSEALVAARR